MPDLRVRQARWYSRRVDFDPPQPMGPPVALPPAILPLDRLAAAFEVLLCSGYPTQLIISAFLVAFGLRPEGAGGELSARFVYALSLLDTVLVVALVVFFFRARGESWRDELFGRLSPARDVMLGIVIVPASFFLITLVLVILQIVAPWLRNVPHNPLAGLAKTRTDAVILGFVVMVAGGVREEVQRGFVLRRFEQYLGGGLVGLAIFSVAFGLGHFTQGRDVVVGTAILGAFWGAIFLARRSILAPMIGHAGFNLAQIVKFVLT